MIDKASEKVILNPTELITNKTLYTLSGASASVWIVCLVIHSILHRSLSNPETYKLIALALSLIISLSMVLEKKKRKYTDWVLAVINGFLIFVYATGFNSISSNIFLSDTENKAIKMDSSNKKLTNSILHNSRRAEFLNLFEINWFPDKRLIKENAELRYVNDSLHTILKSTTNSNYSLQTVCDCNALLSKNSKLQKRIEFLESLSIPITKNSKDKENDNYIRGLVSSINNLKSENFVLQSQLRSKQDDKLVDSLTQVINRLSNQPKQKNNTDLLKEIEKLRTKLIECMDKNENH